VIPVTDAGEWLASLLAREAATLPGLRSWKVEPQDDRVVARLEVESEEVLLVARRPDGLPCWLDGGSVAFNVECARDPAPLRTHDFLVALRGRLDGAAPAEVLFPQGAAAAPRRRLPAGTALQQRLHRAAFFAWKVLESDKRLTPPILRHDGERESEWRTLVLQEFYPYVGAIGEPVPEDDVKAGWARTAERIRSGQAPGRLGLYVHFPFCAVRCRFCYCCVTDTLEKGGIQRYVDTVVASMRDYGPLVGGLPISSVFIGGGTPSLMSVRMLEEWFGALHESFEVPRSTQITVETNPDSLTERKIDVMRDVGRVTRLTIGIQSIDPEVQRRALRFNDPDKIRALVDVCHDRGVLINMDVMVGMDGQTMDAFRKDVRYALSLRPDSLHLSGFRPVHPTEPRGDDEQVHRRRQMLAWGLEELRAHGIEPRLGMPPSRDPKAVNEQIVEWRDHNASLLALGVSAYGHSYGSHFYETCRGYETTGGIDVALGRLRRGGNTFYALPAGDAEEAHRFIIHNLQDGFTAARFRALFGKEPWEVAPSSWAELVEHGIVKVEGDAVRFDVPTYAERAIYGVFFYSEAVRERMERLWGAEYDPAVDYRRRVLEICAGSS
jgi:coproporphyrinogen III oxidase-like Fe-S oxidoreductase